MHCLHDLFMIHGNFKIWLLVGAATLNLCNFKFLLDTSFCSLQFLWFCACPGSSLYSSNYYCPFRSADMLR
jgi:hypothetical protein